MKTTKYKCLNLFGFVFSLLTMNLTAISQTVQWQSIFGNPGNLYADIGYNCIQSIDGTFLVTGRWEIPVPEWPYTRVKAFVARLDTSGNVMWTKLIGDSSVANEAFTIAEDPLGNIYVPYWSGYAHLVKLNADGEMLWDVDYTSSNILGFRGISFLDNNRNIVLLGLSYGMQFDWTTSVTKLDSSGRLIWTRSIFDSIPTIRTYECYNNSFSFSESGYYVCGNQGTSPYILKLDTNGHTLWNNRFNNSRSIYSIEKISDLSLIASCQLLPGLRLLKIDSSGNQYWTRDYSMDTLAGSVGAGKILGIPHHRFALGTSRGQYFARLMIVDSLGSILTSKFFNFSETYTVYQNNINYCFDSGFVFGGYIRNWELSNQTNIPDPFGSFENNVGGKDIDIFAFKTNKAGMISYIGNQTQHELLSLSVKAFPNPTNGGVKIFISSNSFATVTIRLYDIRGSRVLSIEQFILKPGSSELNIDTSNLASGVYFLSTENPKINFINRILLIR